MSTMFLRSIVPALAISAALAAPAAAEPTLITPLDPCYVVATEDQRQLITVRASGFTPFKDVDIYIDDILQYEAFALFDGTINGNVRAPFEEEGTRPFTLRVFEPELPTNSLAATTMVTRLAVEQKPGVASTNERVRFKGRGFITPNAPVYAHYIFAGKVRKSVRMGMPRTPCGTFSVRRKQFPFKKKRPRVGVWTIQFDQNPHYDSKAAVRVPMRIKVRTTPKRESVRAR